MGRQAGRQDGQALIEFALVLPLLVLLLIAIADYGIGYQRYIQLTNAVREGARYGSIYPQRVSPSDSADPENVKARVRTEAVGMGLSDADVAVSYQVGGVNPPPTYDATVAANRQYAVTGSAVQIVATTSYAPFTPFANLLFPGGRVLMSATSVMRIE